MFFPHQPWETFPQALPFTRRAGGRLATGEKPQPRHVGRQGGGPRHGLGVDLMSQNGTITWCVCI